MSPAQLKQYLSFEDNWLTKQLSACYDVIWHFVKMSFQEKQWRKKKEGMWAAAATVNSRNQHQ